MNPLTQKLIENSETSYKEFHSKLVPDTLYPLLGVRVPIIKNLAKNAIKSDRSTILEFISETHTFYEEFMLHALLINSLSNDINELFSLIENFLPQIDNWAICDSFVSSLKTLKKHPKLTLNKVKKYLNSSHPYTVRFAIVTLLVYYLDDNFSEEILQLSIKNCGKHFYIDMAIAWLFSFALIKQYDVTIPYFKNNILTKFVHNKALQKAIESFRVSPNTKEHLKTLKRKA